MDLYPKSSFKKIGAAREGRPANDIARWLDQLIIGCLFLFAIAAPHSIAATQTAWLLGMLFWVIRFACYPRPSLNRSPVDYALIGFFILTGLSSFLSYEPFVSIGKLRAASLFTIVYLVAQNIPARRIVRLLALVMIASFTVNVCFTIAERAWGRGIKLQNVTTASPLAAAVFRSQSLSGRTFHGRGTLTPTPIRSGDTILSIDGMKVNDAPGLAAALAASADSKPALVQIYRVEWTPVLEVPRGKLLPGGSVEAQLGISGWTTGREWRAAGFFGHYLTYAEALQFALALLLALFICFPHKRSAKGLLFGLILAGFVFALILTVTRATWVGAVFAALAILLVSSSRKVILIAVAVGFPLIVAGFFVLKQQRNINFLDRGDQSTTWRETVWREGFNLLVSKPRHLLVGVGMDAIKAHRTEWGLFDNGRLPPGHMHSNLLQIGLERGIPALICWLLLLGVYARTLWRLLRSDALDHWIERGIVLGALGGLCGFFVSGLVHYNWGDSEVVMIFYFIMGLTLSLRSQVLGLKS
jgi:O-Antigen ligase